MNDQTHSHNQVSRRGLLIRWLGGAVCVTFLVSLSISWQSWSRNTGLAQVTTLPIYFSAIWLSYSFWIFLVLLIFHWQKKVPMFDKSQPLWWLKHLGLSLLVGISHLAVDTFLLWLALTQKFSYTNGLTENLLRWMPYELLAYWSSLSVITLIRHRGNLFRSSPKTYLKRLSFKSQDETWLIPVEHIDYIEACDNYVNVWCGNNREMIKQTMAILETKLDPQKFVRVHRSYIVNLDSVKQLNKQSKSTSVTLNQGNTIPVSRLRRAELKKKLLR